MKWFQKLYAENTRILCNDPLKLRSSTLIESVIAMVIIAVAFSIAWMTIGSVFRTDKRMVKFRVEKAMATIEMEMINNRNFIDATLIEKGFIIEKKILPVLNKRNLVRLNLKAISESGEVVLEKNKMIYPP